MIPYYTFPTIPGSQIKPFGLLVGLGVVCGYLVALRRGKQYGVPREELTNLILWTVFPALLGSHVLQVLMYRPEKIFSEPLSLFRFNAGISSFGGMFSFVLAFVLYLRIAKPKHHWLLLWDIVTQGFVFAWIFGRLGCSLAHDHPGIPSDFFLAVQYPDGPRHDLGFYELLLTIFVLVPVSLLIHKHRQRFLVGMQIFTFLVLYTPVRWFLDSLRSADVRYFGWTPGQYSSVVLFGAAGWIWLQMKAANKRYPSPP